MSQTLCCVLWMHHFINHFSRLLRLVVLLPSIKLRRLSHREVKLHAQVKWLLIISEFRLRSSCPQSLCPVSPLYGALVISSPPQYPKPWLWYKPWVHLACPPLWKGVWPVSSTPAARVNLKLPKGPSWSHSTFLWTTKALEHSACPTVSSLGDQHPWFPLGKEEPLFWCTLLPSQKFLVSVPESVFFDHTQSVGNINAEVLRVRASVSHLLTLVLMDGDRVKGFFWNWFIRPRGFPSRSLLSLLRFMCLFNIPSAYWGLSWKLSLRSIFPDSIAETLWCCSFAWKNAPNGLCDWCTPRHPDWWWGGSDWRTVPGRRGWGL